MADQSTQIQTNALAPAMASADGVTAQQHSIADQIAADRYAAAAAGARKKRRGLRFSKILPAGAMSDCQGQRTGSSFDSPGLT